MLDGMQHWQMIKMYVHFNGMKFTLARGCRSICFLWINLYVIYISYIYTKKLNKQKHLLDYKINHEKQFITLYLYNYNLK